MKPRGVALAQCPAIQISLLSGFAAMVTGRCIFIASTQSLQSRQDSLTMEVRVEFHIYDALHRLCEYLCFFAIPFYRQRTRYRIRERLLRGKVLRKQHGPVYVSRLVGPSNTGS